MIVVGIDPGKKGGIYASRNGRLWMGDVMPSSPRGIFELIRDAACFFNDLNEDYAVAYVENVHSMPKQGVASTFTFGRGFGEILGVCAALDIRVELVSPQKWKRAVLAGTAKDKAAAIEFVQREYPMINLVPGRCRVPQDGIADAVCIAHYGMLQELKK